VRAVSPAKSFSPASRGSSANNEQIIGTYAGVGQNEQFIGADSAPEQPRWPPRSANMIAAPQITALKRTTIFNRMVAPIT
jgi:hypothetical protein